MHLILTDNDRGLRIILHSKYDLPDAVFLNGITLATILKEEDLVHHITFGKKISEREKTRKVPCTQYEYKTCLNIEDNKIVMDKFNCKISILYHGHHLDNMIPKDMPECTEEITKEAFDLLLKKESKCTRLKILK